MARHFPFGHVRTGDRLRPARPAWPPPKSCVDVLRLLPHRGREVPRARRAVRRCAIRDPSPRWSRSAACAIRQARACRPPEPQVIIPRSVDGRFRSVAVTSTGTNSGSWARPTVTANTPIPEVLKVAEDDREACLRRCIPRSRSTRWGWQPRVSRERHLLATRRMLQGSFDRGDRMRDRAGHGAALDRNPHHRTHPRSLTRFLSVTVARRRFVRRC